MNYQYDITNFPNERVDIFSLTEECRTQINTPIKYVTSMGVDEIEFVFNGTLSSGEQAVLTTVVQNHQGTYTTKKPTEVIAKIKEENDGSQTQGHFQSMVIDLETTGNEIVIKDYKFPYAISLFSAEWLVDTEHIGDKAEFHLAPDTVVGAITAPITIGQKILPVSQTVIDNIKRGFHVKVNGSDCFGRVCEVNAENLTITTEDGSDVDYNAGEYVKMTVKIVPYWRFTAPGFNSVGESKVGSSYIPANSVLRIVYYNENGQTQKKLFGISIDYLY